MKEWKVILSWAGLLSLLASIILPVLRHQQRDAEAFHARVARDRVETCLRRGWPADHCRPAAR